MTVATVARRLSHSTSTIYALIESKKLPCYRCPGIRISEEQLTDFLKTSQTPADGPSASAKDLRPQLNFVR
ncbi:helix-turn-helix domain-containing protein [Caulifigura coniformis]|uniref:helix-turn-helix domain-containing protein n=1 Tax=Caulifigura coniformis TaxID=2527983 RepID=UPI0018D25525